MVCVVMVLLYFLALLTLYDDDIFLGDFGHSNFCSVNSSVGA